MNNLLTQKMPDLKIGGLVTLNADIQQKCPMVVVALLNDDEILCQWISSQRKVETNNFKKQNLINYEPK